MSTLPHRVEIGDRYLDDSGWERLVSLDLANKRLTIDIGASDMTCNSDELDWLIAALQRVRELTTGA